MPYSSVLSLFGQAERDAILSSPLLEGLEEIRMRAGREAELCGRGQKAKAGFGATQQMILGILQNAAQKSLYAYEEQLRNGFLTIEGGHRIGFCGRVHRKGDDIASIDNFSSLNIRIAREIKGAAKRLYPYIDHNGRILSSLVISPPGVGKTTVLRDLARTISDGGKNVGIIDERCEIACSIDGRATLDVGERSDVLDNCPKAAGVALLTRSMSPDVIVTDEVSGKADYGAILSAVGFGISVLASAHASSLEELESKPYLKDILESGLFDRYLFIGRKGKEAIPLAVYDAALRKASP
ncbi:MAG: stage III sporulation protein AA [Eubacteriaceae bacterium]|jgi:stage III sporulation protein AA|nr:stage III sporulation protein AA [Eubacteriaceae bacterium]